MRAEQDAMMVVRAELCDRLQTLQSYGARQSSRDFAEAVAGIRGLAAAYGLTPVVRLADALERAGRSGDAAGCPRAL
jgi:hypothetical protein